MAYSASTDITAAWYAAAPPPPPTTSSSSPPSSSPRRKTGVDGMLQSSSSSSLGFDKRAKGDSFPPDSYSPEPERPVSRNAMARNKEKERQRARTNSTSTSSQHYHHTDPNVLQSAAPVAPTNYHQYVAPVQRERHDSSPATHAPWSTYPQQPSYAYAQTGYYQQQGFQQAAPPFQPVYGLVEQQSPLSYSNPPWTAAMPAAPMQMQAYHPIGQPSVPFPTNMPPPAIPASQGYAHASGSRPLPSPSRSSSQSSSIGTGPSSPSLGSISGTVRRSLPQPPVNPLAQVAAAPDQPHSPSPLGRHDSVRMAAEEMMSRGPPRRKNMSMGSRFAPSANVTKSDGSINEGSKVALDHQQPQQRSGGRVARAESASCLEKEMRELKLKEERRQSTSSSSSSSFVAPPHQEMMRAASPRPIRAAPQPAPEVSIAAPVEEVIPVRPVSRGPKDERERRRSTASFEASNNQVPIIFSPPPDAKPPMPTFSFEEAPVSVQPGMPSIVLPGEEVPAIQVEESPSIKRPHTIQVDESPMIHVTSDSSEDSEESETPKANISISVSSSNMAQRCSTTMMATDNNHNNHHQQHHQHHNHAHDLPLAAAAPASASSVGSGASCATCQKWIGGRVVHAMSHTFHPDCFVCCHCSEHLEHVAFYEHEGRPYCHFDYHELFSKRCFHCRTPIVDQRYITINDVDLVGGNEEERCYHDLHFFCANCGDPFLDPKLSTSAASITTTNMEMMMIEDENGKVTFGGREFIVYKGYPYCETCHISLHKPKCKGCKKPILEMDYLTALKAKWHLECFSCQWCKNPITTETYFVSDGNPYDTECYKIKLRSEL